MKTSVIPYEEALREALAYFMPELKQGSGEYKRVCDDIVSCGFSGTFTPEEYFIFGLADKSFAQRKTFVSRSEKDRIMMGAIGTGEHYC